MAHRHQQERLAKFLVRRGMTATVTIVTGTQCPCMISRDPNNPSYNPEWHVTVNPSADDCGGSGLINTTTTVTTVYASFMNEMQNINTLLTDQLLKEIGEVKTTDVIMVGQFEADGTFFNMSQFSEQSDKVTFGGVDYVVRHYHDIYHGELVGQVSLLKRKEA
jgi:hypothetical protein